MYFSYYFTFFPFSTIILF